MKGDKLEDMFSKCIEEMRPSILALGKKYPIDLVNSAMLELGLRMLLMRAGSTHTLHMFSSTVAAILEKGPLVEAFVESNELDEVDWLENGSLIKPTLH
jgi:hypothetical protein|tara:strand:+ start:713 stop:1009 length:297 start_codon:yes stop_codon:yes gene_type:complete